MKNGNMAEKCRYKIEGSIHVNYSCKKRHFHSYPCNREKRIIFDKIWRKINKRTEDSVENREVQHKYLENRDKKRVSPKNNIGLPKKIRHGLTNQYELYLKLIFTKKKLWGSTFLR